MIILIVKIIEVIRRYLGRTCFKVLKEESKKRNRFIGNDGKLSFIKLMARSSIVKQYIVKVVEPEYSIENEIKKLKIKNKEKEMGKEKEKESKFEKEEKEENMKNTEEEEKKENKDKEKENISKEKKNENPIKKFILNLK